MKMYTSFGIVFLLCCASLAVASRNHRKNNYDESVGKPLFLTPFIELNHSSLARGMARNRPLLGDIESYSGFLTVNASTDTNAFFWYFPAERNSENAPLVIWLQGGPGVSSMLGAMFEIGPYQLRPNGRLRLREHHWAKHFNVLFIDNPAGSGYSFTKNGYATNQEEVGEYLYHTLKQFLFIFNELENRPLYITGESYGGKFVTSMAHAIYVHNKNESNTKINLEGVAIGSGLIDPVNMMVHGPLYHQIGLFDDRQLDEFTNATRHLEELIRAENWNEATNEYYGLFNNASGHPGLILNMTGFSYQFNLLFSKNDGAAKQLKRFANKPHVRRSLHVGKAHFNGRKIVRSHLYEDKMKSVLPSFIDIVENYNVLLFNGQLDLRVPYVATVNFVKRMDWSGKNCYEHASRRIWMSGRDLAGYTKTVYHSNAGIPHPDERESHPENESKILHDNDQEIQHRVEQGIHLGHHMRPHPHNEHKIHPNGERKLHFTEALVRNAGHMAPHDRPKWVLDLVTKFITLQEPF